MAEEIIFRVGVDTAGAAKGIEAVDKELKDLEKTSNSAGSGLEKAFTDIQKRVESGKLSYGELSGVIKEYHSIAELAGETSPIGQQAIKEAADLTKKLDALNNESDELNVNLEDIVTSTDSVENKFRDLNKAVSVIPKSLNGINAQMEAYKAIALQAGATSPIGQEALVKAGELKREYEDLERQVNILSARGQNMQAALQLGSTIMAGYGALQGVTALVGKENEDLTETLVKLNAVQTLLISLEEIRAALEEESVLRIKATTIAQKLYTLAVGETTGAMKLLRLAMIATGIGALIVGIVLLVQNWDKLTGVIGSTKIAQEGLNATLDDYKQGATDAVKETSQVKVAFDLAKQGVISKDEALKTYNDTLGDTFGKAKSLNEAEALYYEKTGAYIKATAMRKQADALLTLAAEEQAKALTAQMENQVGFWDNELAALQGQFGFIQESQKSLAEGQKKGVVEAKKISEQKSSIYTQEAEKLMMSAEVMENANGIKSESEQKLLEEQKKNADELAKKRKEAADKAREEEERRAEELKRLEREITDATIAAIADRETRERMALAEKHRRELEDLRAQYGERQELIMALEEKQAIEQQNFERTQDEISQQIIEDAKAKKAADDQAQIDAAKTTSLNLLEIWKKSQEDQKAIDEAIFQSRASFASNVASVIGQLSGLAKEGTATQKALALTEIAINTAVGFVQGLRIAQQSAAASGPAAAFVFPIFYAQQLAAVLGAAKQAKNILGSGTSVSAPSSPSGGSGFNSGSIIQYPGSSLTETGSSNTQLNPPGQVQVVLVTDSLKKVQGQSQIAENIATFG